MNTNHKLAILLLSAGLSGACRCRRHQWGHRGRRFVLGLWGNQVAAGMGWEGWRPESLREAAFGVTTFVGGGTKGRGENHFSEVVVD